MRGGGISDGFEAGHVRGEAADRDARVVAADEIDQGTPQIGLGPGGARPQRVRGIADHREDALVAEPLQRRLVGGLADQRIGIELPIPGMQHRAGRRAHDDRVRLGDRMGEGNQLEVERADLKPPRHRHDIDLDPAREAGLAELCPQHRGGERGRPNRAAQLVPQIGDGADVVFVRMRCDDPQQTVASLGDKAGVGHDDIEAGLRIIAEGHAAIDDQPVALISVEVEVHADLAGAAERREIEGTGIVPVRRAGAACSARSRGKIVHRFLFLR